MLLSCLEAAAGDLLPPPTPCSADADADTEADNGKGKSGEWEEEGSSDGEVSRRRTLHCGDENPPA